MISTALIIFRETIEIAMILGVVLAATRNLPNRFPWIIGGFASGVCGAGLVALFTQTISNAVSGIGQELFNAAILAVAALMIGCTILWMRKHAREMSAHLKQVGQDVTAGTLPLYSLSLIIGLSMLREGSEIVMFIYGMLLSGQNGSSIVSGTIAGLVLGITVGVMLYYGLLKIPARHALKVTSWVLVLLVAGLMSQSAGYLSAAGYFSGLSTPVWDTSWLLSEEGITGKTLHSLIGYTATPTAIQLIGYLGTLLLLCILMLHGHKRNLRTVAAASVLALFALVKPSSASAVDHVYEPIVTKGEASVEYIGNRTFDSHADKNNVQGQQVEFEYGVTDHWKAIVSGSFAKEPSESLKMEATEFESVFQFGEQGEHWVDSGLLAAYHIATQSHEPDSIEAKLLLQKDVGDFTHTANIGAEKTIGHYSEGTGGPSYSLIANSRYRLGEYLQPGIELQSDFGKGRTLGNYSKQEHYIGPSAYGRLFGKIRYQAALYAGISDAASQGAARFLLEYEMHF